MTAKKRSSRSEIALLPEGFSVEEHLTRAERAQVDARFFGEILGRKGDSVFVETEEGVYQFNQEDIKEIRPLHKALDMLTISRNATFTMHGSIARAIRMSAAQEQRRVPDATIDALVERDAPLKEIVDTLGGLGTREWRG